MRRFETAEELRQSNIPDILKWLDEMDSDVIITKETDVVYCLENEETLHNVVIPELSDINPVLDYELVNKFENYSAYCYVTSNSSTITVFVKASRVRYA